MTFYQSVLNELKLKQSKLEEAIENSNIMISQAADRIDEANSDERTEKARHQSKLDQLRLKYEDAVEEEVLRNKENQRKIDLYRSQAEGEIANRKAAIPSYEQEIKDVKELIKETEKRANND